MQMKFMRTVLIIIPAIIALIFIVSCDFKNSSGVAILSKNELMVPVDQNGYTSEQKNILGRRKVSLDPKQIMWIYCLADNGQVIFYGAVKGKVTSSTKKLDENMVSSEVGNFSDGSQGESDPYVYWFDPSGKYFQWNGHYFLSTYEIKIQTPVLNTRSVQ